ncbi:MAG TPA: NAD(P)/FAD-dependent oxidoreductase [Euzebyales bacterium]|nr:NAD(P)/FAD-dependent oxidoreductase [Euzebyales bacterium]
MEDVVSRGPQRGPSAGARYDAIVVGARCAGAPTAMLLARKGHRVLLVDRASFPSDTLSTLWIHAPGVAALARWGLLDAVTATGCPPITTYAFDFAEPGPTNGAQGRLRRPEPFGPFTIAGTPRPHDGVSTAYAPRRTVLDKILVDAAVRAGVEVRERFTVDDVLVEDGTVAGIRGRGDGGTTVTERARVVIGADGRYSRVARAVRPAQYHDVPRLQQPYYTFWSGLPVDGAETVIRGDRAWAAVPTNDGLTLLVVGWPFAEAAAYKADIEGNYLRTLDVEPAWAARVRAATREERFLGGAVPNFFRTPYGPGWALVGDAGYTKDPVTAQGISDAFRDAELCATALDDAFTGRRAFDDAMFGYQHARDARALPIYDFTTQMAALEPPPPQMQHLLGAVSRNRDAMDAFVSVVAGTLSPVEFFHPDHIGPIMAAATT